MTRHKALHTGLVSPSPLDRLINALLHPFAMLMSHVARRFASRNQISAAECDGSCESMPEANFVLDQHQEPTPAAASGHAPRTSASSSTASAIAAASAIGREGLMVSSVVIATRPSNHEAGLTALSTSHPRACPEDFGSDSGGTRPNPHDLPTEILGMRFAYPRITRVWSCEESHQASAPN